MNKKRLIRKEAGAPGGEKYCSIQNFFFKSKHFVLYKKTKRLSQKCQTMSFLHEMIKGYQNIAPTALLFYHP